MDDCACHVVECAPQASIVPLVARPFDDQPCSTEISCGAQYRREFHTPLPAFLRCAARLVAFKGEHIYSIEQPTTGEGI